MKFKRSFPFSVHLSTLLISLVSITCILLAVFTYVTSRDLQRESAQELMSTQISEISAEIDEMMLGPKTVVSLISRQTGLSSLSRSTNYEQRSYSVPLLAEALSNTPVVSALFAGYENGDFFMLRRGEVVDVPHELNSEAGWVVTSITAQDSGARILTERFLDREFRLIGARTSRTEYDPRRQPWYLQSIDAAETVRTDPHWLKSEKRVGIVYARRALLPEPDRLRLLKMGYTRFNEAVIGASVHLESFSEVISNLEVTTNTQIVIFDNSESLVADKSPERVLFNKNELDQPIRATLTQLHHPALDHVKNHWNQLIASGKTNWRFNAAGDTWLSSLKQLPIEIGPPLFVSINVPESELYAGVTEMRNSVIFISLGLLALMVPIALLIARGMSHSVESINQDATAIRHFDFSDSAHVQSSISEISNLGISISNVKQTIRNFTKINLAVASENNFERLLSLVLKDTLESVGALSGALYLNDKYDHNQLHLKRTADGYERRPEPNVKYAIPGLLQEALKKDCVLTGNITNEELEHANMAGLKIDGERQCALAIPLTNRSGESVGALLLLSRDAFETGQIDFVTALCASLTVSVETRTLIESQKELFEAFVKLIASAIDAKSPYTGGHCSRVPELTKMLAKAAHESDQFGLKDFAIDEDEWEAIHVAAWLHDCGKVTTPEFVVDKSTKLETIYDRIHEVRMRFEVLRRDAQIHYLQGILNGGDEPSLKRQLDDENKALDEDFSFIAECNLGGEFMAEDRIERLAKIGARKWMRTFDDRIGISHEELERKERSVAQTLPVEELLLADKPEHYLHRRQEDCIPDDNPWGFKLDTPQLLYNRGELHNLSVARGTLSEEERFKINEHIVQTIIMLSSLPFPKHLRDVPEIAGGHHEKINGTGYPKRLKGEEMGVVAKLMAIADIFEALTAVDRPYKKGKTVSEAVKIMNFMVKDDHIDPDLFKLFLSSGIHFDYAKKYLKPDQIDSFDIEQYL